MTNFNCCSKYLELNLHTILASGCSSQVATAPHCLTVLPRFSLVKVWERPFPPVQRPQDFHICRSAGLLCWNSSASTKDVRWLVNPCELMFWGWWTGLRHVSLQPIFQAGAKLNSAQQNVGIITNSTPKVLFFTSDQMTCDQFRCNYLLPV